MGPSMCFVKPLLQNQARRKHAQQRGPRGVIELMLLACWLQGSYVPKGLARSDDIRQLRYSHLGQAYRVPGAGPCPLYIFQIMVPEAKHSEVSAPPG